MQPKPESIARAAKIVKIAIDAVAEMQRMAREKPERVETLLGSAWATHVHAYDRLIDGKPGPAEDSLQFLGEISAVLVLSEYFKRRGDWAAMLSNLQDFARKLKAREVEI